MADKIYPRPESYRFYEKVLLRHELIDTLAKFIPEDKGIASDDLWEAACKRGIDEATLAFEEIASQIDADEKHRSSALTLKFLKAGVEARNAYLKAHAH